MTTHKHLIQCMQALGYKSNDTGICLGLAQMVKQAILVDGLKEFDDRIEKIGQLSVGDFKKIAGELQKPRRERKFSDLGINLTPEDVTDFLAFFDGIELYFQKSQYAHLFEGKQNLSQRNTAPAEAILLPTKAETGIARIDSFSRVYDCDTGGIHMLLTALTSTPPIAHDIESISQLSQLLSALASTQATLALCLNNFDHQICIGFNPKTQEFSFTDSQSLPTRYYSAKQAQVSFQLLACDIMLALGGTISFDLYTSGVKPETLSPILQQIKPMILPRYSGHPTKLV